MKIRARKKKLDTSRRYLARFLMDIHQALREVRNGELTPYLFSTDRRRARSDR